MDSVSLVKLTPTLTAGLITSLEALVNEALRLDASSAEKLRRLDGQWLRVEVTPFQQSFYLCADYPLRITLELADQPHANISGRPLSLLRFWRFADSADGLSITGNQSFAKELAGISSHLDVDWESKLAELIGDLPAHFVSNRLREANDWKNYVQHHFFRDADEYLHHESRFVPDDEEVKLWSEDIVDLTKDLELLDQRLTTLEAFMHEASAAGKEPPRRYADNRPNKLKDKPSGNKET